jgi:hypothetical protein
VALLNEIARDLALAMLAKSGVKEWLDAATREAIVTSAVEMAEYIFTDGYGPMAAPTSVFRKQFATAKTFKKTSGSAAMTPSTLANGAYWQSAKLDLGNANGCVAQAYNLRLNVDLAATPTAGNQISFWWCPSDSGTAGTDNAGGCSGADATYAGYSSNAAASVNQLQFIGSFICTTQTSTQSGIVQGLLIPNDRYGSLVMVNNSGVAFASDTNFVVTLTPEEFTAEAV